MGSTHGFKGMPVPVTGMCLHSDMILLVAGNGDKLTALSGG